jgi:hypothetical protein
MQIWIDVEECEMDQTWTLGPINKKQMLIRLIRSNQIVMFSPPAKMSLPTFRAISTRDGCIHDNFECVADLKLS